MPAEEHGTIMRRSRGSWALGAVAPWCLGVALAISVAAEAGEEMFSGASIAPLPLRTQGAPPGLIPAQPSALGIDLGTFPGEAQQMLRQASLSVGANEEFNRRLAEEIEPRADMKRNAREFPTIDRTRRGDPWAGLRPAFDTRLRNFPGLLRFRADDSIFRRDTAELAGNFSSGDEALGPESVGAFEPWTEGESPTTAQSGTEVSPAQPRSPETMRPAVLTERLMQGATPAVLRAVGLGSATPAAADAMPIEAVVVPRGYFSHDVGSEAARPNYAVLSGWDVAADENRCLAEAIYFEARGESEEGQAAVAQVVLNRVSSGLYPPTICSVVYQNRRHFNACQFSFACSGNPLRITEPDAWREAQRIAAEVSRGGAYLPEIGGATHFHANYVRPRWARRLEKMDVIGHHIFYKLKPGQS